MPKNTMFIKIGFTQTGSVYILKIKTHQDLRGGNTLHSINAFPVDPVGHVHIGI